MYMKKHINKRNTKRNTKKNRRKTGKKGCGCKSNIFFAMKKKIVGGNINPASFQNFQSSQNQYYYDVNTHNNDPNNPSMLTSSRNLPNYGGNKKTQKTQKITKKNNKSVMRKMKGGDSLFGPGNDALSSFGNIEGTKIGSAIFSNSFSVNPSPILQPAFNGVTKHLV